MTAICKGIVTTQKAIAAATSERARFVHVEASFRYDTVPGADSGEALLLADRRFLATDLVTGAVGALHPLLEYLQSNGVADADLSWFQDNAVRPDVLGMNYYPMWSTIEYSGVGDESRGIERDDGTAGLIDVLRTASTRYGVPVMLTETSFEGSTAQQAHGWSHQWPRWTSSRPKYPSPATSGGLSSTRSGGNTGKHRTRWSSTCIVSGSYRSRPMTPDYFIADRIRYLRDFQRLAREHPLTSIRA